MSDRVLVGIPLGSGGVPAPTFSHLLEACQGHDVKTHIARTDLNRNWLCQYAIEQGYDWLVMLDVDHQHPADIVDRLVAHKQPVVAALAFQRMAPYDAMAYIQGDGVEVIANWGGGLMRITWCASCAICIDTRALAQLEWPWWHYPVKRKYLEGVAPPTTETMNAECPTEDIGFCENCRKAGVPVCVDTGLVTPHMSTFFVDETVYAAVRAG